MELNSVKIQQNYKKILEDIKKYSPYPEKVKILFVSKYLNVEEHKILIEMGYDYFGENRAQLYRDKLNKFSDEKYKNINCWKTYLMNENNADLSVVLFFNMVDISKFMVDFL